MQAHALPLFLGTCTFLNPEPMLHLLKESRKVASGPGGSVAWKAGLKELASPTLGQAAKGHG